jgi:4-nitrophenyl phosphatase
MRVLPTYLHEPVPGVQPSPPQPSGETAALDLALAGDRLANASGFVIDLDGTLVSGNRVMPGAQALLHFARDRYAIVSNNSRDTAVPLARRLARLGLKVEPARIVLAGEHAVLLVARRYPRARLRIVASSMLKRFAVTQGCNVVEQDPDVILLGRDLHFSYARLQSIANQLRNGATLIVANPDHSHPSEDGGVTPETGSLMNAVVACAGVEPACIVGKPEPLLFQEALRRLGTSAAATLVIGDNPLTDGAGARQSSMQCLLVGQHRDAHVASLALVLLPGTSLSGSRESSVPLERQHVEGVPQHLD